MDVCFTGSLLEGLGDVVAGLAVDEKDGSFLLGQQVGGLVNDLGGWTGLSFRLFDELVRGDVLDLHVLK